MNAEILQSIGLAFLGIAQILTSIHLIKIDNRLDSLYNSIRRRMR